MTRFSSQIAERIKFEFLPSSLMSYRKFRDFQKELAFAIESIWPPCERIDLIVADIDVWVTTDFCTARRLAPTWRRDVQLMVNDLALPTPLRSWASGELSVQRLFKSFESVSALSYPAYPASKAFARVKKSVLPPTTVWVARLYGTWSMPKAERYSSLYV